MIRTLEVAVHFCAEEAAGERVVGVASDTRRAAALDRRDGRAGIRAIVRTRPAHDTGIAVSENRGAHGRARSRTRRRSISKRYVARRRGATLVELGSNTFDSIELPGTAVDVAILEYRALLPTPNRNGIATGTKLPREPPAALNALLSLHLDNVNGLDTDVRVRRFSPRSWYRVRGPWQRSSPSRRL